MPKVERPHLVGVDDGPFEKHVSRDTPVVAAVTVASDPGVCSAPCKKGCEYAFNATVPPELCVNAAHTLLKTVLALQHVPPSDDHKPAAPMTLRCVRANCNAVFEVRCQS